MGYEKGAITATGCMLPEQGIWFLFGISLLFSLWCLGSLWRKNASTGRKLWWSLVVMVPFVGPLFYGGWFDLAP